MTPSVEIERVLRTELASLEALQQALSHELEALTDADSTALDAAVAAKEQALAEQRQVSAKRRQLLHCDVGDDDATALTELIAHYSDNTDLKALRDTINQRAQQCFEINRSNGRLIQQKQSQARSALNILRHSDNEGSTYSGRGDTLDRPASKSLGTA